MPDRPKPWPFGLHGSRMHDWVVRELEVGRRVANAEDDEACGTGPLLDAYLVEYMARCDEEESSMPPDVRPRYAGILYRFQCLLFGRGYARLAARFRAEHSGRRHLPEDGWYCNNTTWTGPTFPPDVEETDDA